MKETPDNIRYSYYKIDRENISTLDAGKIADLVDAGILEEVQEEGEKYKAIDAAADEYEKACKNMFGNPLEQVDAFFAEVGLKDDSAQEPKPFLDGMTPSEWIFDKHPYGEHSPTITMLNTQRCLDLLVEELKRKGSL